jgi:hypothetical protein
LSGAIAVPDTSLAPTLHRVAQVIKAGPFSHSTFYRLVREKRVALVKVGKRMTFTTETGDEIALRLAREDAAEQPEEQPAA